MSNAINSIRKFICYNQKELIQYEYLISEKHKKLRLHFDKENNKGLLNEYIESLLNYAYWQLIDIFEENNSRINSMFESIGIEKSPNITIKTLEKGSVLDFYRSRTMSTLSVSKINDNTGFSEIMKSPENKYFIRHDLEKEFKEKRYKNPRLIESYRNDLISGKKSWEECWKPINEDSNDLNTSYCSTLIIPMAIKIDNNKDNELFLNKFSKSVISSEHVRTVWGFLCFDYKEKNIFLGKEKELVDIGYIISDILSLYLMFFYNHISGSETYKKVISKLKDKK